MMLIFVLIIGLLAYWLLSGKDIKTNFSQKSDAEQILRSRYAKGEVGDDDFREMLKTLKE